MNPPEFLGSQVGEDPQNFIDEVKKIFGVMQVTDNVRVKLASYQFKDAVTAKDVHMLARLGVRLMSISNGGVIVQNGSESSLVPEVKEKQDSDPILLQLKGEVHQQRVEVFSQGGDGVLRY
uniref:Gag-pol polyprotein n=1 Tax=Solanum tuberosum TaxID=4113 RepID=M1DVB7_SOLTU